MKKNLQIVIMKKHYSSKNEKFTIVKTQQGPLPPEFCNCKIKKKHLKN
jgi:hypothetical protein